MLTGCAEEAATPSNGKSNQQEPDTKGLTAFVVEENDTKTRTTAEYFNNGGLNRGLHYYWTAGDRLWVNNGGTLIQDASNTISDVLTNNTTTPGGVKRASKASFSFEGTFTAQSYPVRYTGTGSTAGDKVTIKTEQKQAIANDASHIGEDGDCGTAVATKPAGGSKYFFTLKHKAAYLTFLPYSTINFSNSVKVTQIKVTADKAICGQFDFNDNGLDINNRPAATPTNQSITLTLNGGNTNGFPILTSAQIASNAATMVIAPGTYSTLTVEYTLYDQATKGGGTMTKTYSNVTLTEGKNKKISQNLQQPPQILSYSYGPWHVGLYSGGTTPNVHAGMWYMHKGDPHIDTLTMTVVRLNATAPANLIRGGLWLKKKAFIPGFTPSRAPNGANYLKHHNPLLYMYSEVNGYKVNVPIGKPADVTNYFFLMSAGFNGSTLYSGNGGTRYWMGNGFKDGDMGQVFGTDVKPNPVVEIGSNPKAKYQMYWTYQ